MRYDSATAVTAINDLYEDVRLLQNLFLPSVKLVEKQRVGSRVPRKYDAPQTPLDRLVRGGKGDPEKVCALTSCAIRAICHIDRAPLGDVAGSLLAVMLSEPCDVSSLHRLDDRGFAFRTADMRTELGGCL